GRQTTINIPAQQCVSALRIKPPHLVVVRRQRSVVGEGRSAGRVECNLTLPPLKGVGFSVRRSPPGRARSDTISLSVPLLRATFMCAPPYVAATFCALRHAMS